MTEKRESWITLAKAVALILVIFIHSIFKDDLSSYLTGFVMPAFFVLYGVSHNTNKCRHDLKTYIFNRARALMIPYFILSIVMFGIYFAVYPTVDLGFPPFDFIYWLIYGNGPMGPTGPQVTHLWFLRTMFFAIILFSVIDRYLHDKSVIFRAIILAITPGIGVMLKYSTGVVLVPWGMDAVLIALSFMMIGSEIRRHRHLSPWTVNSRVDIVGLILAIAMYSYLSISNSFVNIGESTYGNSIYVYMATGVLGTYIVCLLSYHTVKKFPSIARYATSYNDVGQEIYEIHPLIIQFNYYALGGLAIWYTTLNFYPPAPMVIINFPLAMILSYLFASKIVSRSSILEFMFLGFRKPKQTHPKETFPVPEPNGSDELECVEEATTDG